jgi:hypothetical protein
VMEGMNNQVKRDECQWITLQEISRVIPGWVKAPPTFQNRVKCHCSVAFLCIQTCS